jgi:hypothetical protein
MGFGQRRRYADGRFNLYIAVFGEEAADQRQYFSPTYQVSMDEHLPGIGHDLSSEFGSRRSRSFAASCPPSDPFLHPSDVTSG